MGNFYVNENRSVKRIVNEKIQVLRDFYIVDDENEYSTRQQLTAAITNAPDRDPDVIADRFARSLISEKLYS